MRKFKFILPLAIFFAGLQLQSATADLQTWFTSEVALSKVELLKNVSRPGTAPGSVIASPSQDNPNYFFHWTRDASLVMDSLVITGESEPASVRAEYSRLMELYIDFSRKNQLVASLFGIGEPRLNVDGTPNFLDWSRPQNDGPALRTLTLLRYLKMVDQKVFTLTGSGLATLKEVVQADLNYIYLHRNETDYDLWEECKGKHYDTQLKQTEALKQGAHYLNLWHLDPQTSANYLKASVELEASLDRYWSLSNKSLLSNLDRVTGADNKKTFLDSAVVLAALHVDRKTGPHSVTDSRIQASVKALEDIFKRVYAINTSNSAPAIGRYADDVYFGGNPWYLTTAAFGQFHFELAASLKNEILVVNQNNLEFWKALLPSANLKIGLSFDQKLKTQAKAALIARGNEYLQTLRSYTPANGHLSEQFGKADGVPMSAPDLTWSYAAILTLSHSKFLAEK